MRGHHRSAWLVTRLQCERLRQLHFQLLLGRFDLAVRAMRDPDALTVLVAERQRALVRFRDRYMATPSPALHDVLDDSAHEHAWINDTWDGEPPSGKDLPAQDANELLDVLRRLRFGVQRHYASLSVQKHISAPRMRSDGLQGGADVLTVGILIASFTLALALIFEWTEWRQACVAFVAIFAAGVAALRTLEDGLRYGGDEPARVYRRVKPSEDDPYEQEDVYPDIQRGIS